jgi:aromatic ring-opening dioxygenase LigB subunit
LLNDDAGGALATRAAMEEMGRRAAAAGVEALVIAGPHGIRIDGAVCLADTARAAGSLAWQGREVELNVPVDGPLTAAITTTARSRGIPIALAAYGGHRRDLSVLPLDWGVLTPLWFLGHNRTMPGYGTVIPDRSPEDIGPPAVIVTPSRTLPREVLVDFGRAVADAATGDPRRIGFVASCDWAHTLTADGPYGFFAGAAAVDADIVAAVTDDDLMRLVTFDEDRAQAAYMDGLWQALMLAGALDEVPMRADFLGYEAPTYYGMLVAVWTPGD